MAKYYIGVLLLNSMLGGCAIFPGKQDALALEHYELVADDFASVLSQVKGMAPVKTTLLMKKERTAFGRALYQALREEGYGLRYVPAPEKQNYVEFASDTFERGGEIKTAYRVVITGRVELGREYEVRAGMIYPTSAMSIAGGEHVGKQLDDSRFYPAKLTTGRRGEIGNSLVGLDARTSNPYLAGPKQSNAAGDDSAEAEEVMSKVVLPNTNTAILGTSNYSDLLTDYMPVETITLVFDNDSTEIKHTHGVVIRELLKSYSPDSDRFLIIGCSHGRTGIPNGNAVLAIGRADVIKGELVKQGVSMRNIFPEGCWSGDKADAKDEYPSRGVVLKLMRFHDHQA